MSSRKVTVDLDISIRPVRTEELEDLRTLDREVFGTLAYEPFFLRQLFDVFRRYWLVADDASGGLVGYSLGVPTPDRDEAWLLGLAVAPECRNLGIGERLTLCSLELLKAKSPVVYLTVQPSNEIAIALYKRVGFVFNRLSPDYFGTGEDRVIMAHTFTESSAVPSPRPNS